MRERLEPKLSYVDGRRKRFVFVLMPFKKTFEDLYDSGIKVACHSVGAYCERVDEQIYTGTILDRIYDQIAKADLIVSEMTGQNANVFYETGYAHALAKRVVLLATDAKDIPFDLRSYPHLIHENSIKKIKAELPAHIREYLAEDDSAAQTVTSLKYQLGGKPLRNGSVVRITIPPGSMRDDLSVKFRFAVNNPTNRILETENLEFGIIVPSEFCAVESQSASPDGDLLPNRLVRLSAQQNLHFIGGPARRLFPDAWWMTDISFPVSDWRPLKERKLHCSARMYSETGPQDTRFDLELVEKLPGKPTPPQKIAQS